jgi:hypothetical protein
VPLDSEIAIQERTLTRYGLNLYDGATWEIALALEGVEGFGFKKRTKTNKYEQIRTKTNKYEQIRTKTNKYKQNKYKQNKYKQNKYKQNKCKQNKYKQIKCKQNKYKQIKCKQVKCKQIKYKQIKYKQIKCKQNNINSVANVICFFPTGLAEVALIYEENILYPSSTGANANVGGIIDIRSDTSEYVPSLTIPLSTIFYFFFITINYYYHYVILFFYNMLFLII